VIFNEMNSTLNRTLGKKVVRDSRFLYCVWFSYRCKLYGHIWFWEGSTPLGTGSSKIFAIFQNILEMYHFGRSYLEIWLVDSSESMLVGKVKQSTFNSPFCVPAKVTKLIGLKRPPFLCPTNLIIFACTQNGELKI
jgi:hypothetical protein